MEARLKTELWVKAHLRRCAVEAVPAFVLRHGDDDSGMVLLKINALDDGCKVFTQARDLDGRQPSDRERGYSRSFAPNSRSSRLRSLPCSRFASSVVRVRSGTW